MSRKSLFWVILASIPLLFFVAAELVLRAVFWRQISVLGTTMGSPAEFGAMLDLYARDGLHPVVDRVFPLADATAAHRRMEEAGQFGKIVLSVA